MVCFLWFTLYNLLNNKVLGLQENKPHSSKHNWFWTRKRSNCECIATWGRPKPRQSFSALITTPCQVWSRWTSSWQYYSVLLLIHYFTLWSWPLTFDFWTFTVYLLWRDESWYQIGTLWSNPRGSFYCDFNIWTWVTRCARLWDNFHQVWPSKPICAWIIAYFILIRYVTLWPWRLTFWPWTFTGV